MGQVLEILRTKEDGSPSDSPITLDEWRAVIAADSSLVEFTVPGNSSTPGVRWIGHPKGREVRFAWENGSVFTNYDDDLMFAKTQEIARALKARIRHEEGEFLEDIDLTKRGGCGAFALLVLFVGLVIWFLLRR